jgi:hypothetical protein
MTLSVQEINNYSLPATQTHSKNMEKEAGRSIYIIRKRKIERSRRYRESDR